MTMKLVKTATALALGASLISTAVVSTDASAASKYKISKGKLVIAKTGKVAKGYVTYKSLVYKDGKKLTGLKGKTYYKAGKKATGTYKGAYYYKGAQKVTTGTYKGAYYVKGVKKVTTGLYNNRYYKSGVKATGTYKGAYYVKGVKKVTTGYYAGAYYVKGYKKVTTGFYNDVLYIKGKENKELAIFKDSLFDGSKLNEGVVLFDEKLFDGYKLNKGYKLYKEDLYNNEKLNEGQAIFGDKLYVGSKLSEGLVTFVGEDKKEVVYNNGELANGTFEVEGKEVAYEDGKEVAAKVASVEAINNNQIKVTFNKSVDAKTDNLESTMTLGGVAASAAKVEGKTVTYTFLANVEGEKAVVIEKLKTTAKEDITRYAEIMNFAKDTVAPTIVGTEQISSSQVKVKFSEPIATFNEFKFQYADGKSVEGVTTAGVADKATEAIFDLSDAKVETGKVIKVTAIGLKDVAGNLITPNPATFEITKLKADGIAPVVSSVSQTGAKTFELTFSKAVKAGTVEVAGHALTLATATDKAATDTTFVVTSDKLLEGVQNVTIKDFADIDGQKIADTTKVITFVKDEVNPTVTSSKIVKVDGKENIELTFSKAVKAGDVTVTGTSVKDFVTTDLKATTVAAVAPTEDKSKKVLLVPVAKFATDKDAKYDVKINSTVVVSDAGQAMKETAVSFTRGTDETIGNVIETVFNDKSIEVAQGKTPSEVTVTFTGEADGASATNISNYVIDGAVVESAKLAPVEAGKQVVTLTLKAESNTFTGVRNITVSNVKVKDSVKVMSPVTFNTVSLLENVSAKLETAKMTANNKVELKFSEVIKTPVAKLFAGTEEIADSVVTAEGNTVTITLKESTTFTAAQLAAGLKVDFQVTDGPGNVTKVEKAVIAQ